MIINYIVDNKKPYSLADFPETKEMVYLLRDKNALAIAEDEKVYSIYPISAHQTIHQVMLEDGRKLYAMCAIDALGCTYTFGQDTEIHSQCSNSGEDIVIKIKDQKIAEASSDEIRILHADLKSSNSWSSCCCGQMLYFKSQKDFDEYAQEHQVCKECTFCLDLEDGFTIGRMLFRDDE